MTPQKVNDLIAVGQELYKNNGENTLLCAGVDSLIQHLSCAPNIKRLWLDYVKMTPQKVMGAGISSVIQHLTSAPHLKRLWLYKVKMTPQKVMDAGISSVIQHLSCAPNVKRLAWLCEDDSTKGDGCRSKQRYSTSDLRSSPKETVALQSEDDSTKSNGCKNR